jgi:hypothetical protein
MIPSVFWMNNRNIGTLYHAPPTPMEDVNALPINRGAEPLTRSTDTVLLSAAIPKLNIPAGK